MMTGSSDRNTPKQRSRIRRPSTLARIAGVGATILLLAPSPALADTPGTSNTFQLDNTVLNATPFPGFVFGGAATGGTGRAFASVPNASSFVASSGMLDSPYYRSSATGNPFFGLTYEPPQGIPLSFALGVGTANATDWHRNDKLIHSQPSNGRDDQTPVGNLEGNVDVATTVAFAVTDQTIVAGGSVGTGQHHRGPGTLTVEGTLGFTAGPALGVRHVYVLLPGTNYLEVTTTISNASGSTVNNVNMWVGTSDDWIEETDSPKKVKGQIQGSANTAVFNAACSGVTNAIILSSGGAYMMVYSPAPGADTSLKNGFNDWNTEIVNLAPAASEFDVEAGDGSFGLYLPFGDMANSTSKSLTWYFEGGELTFPAPQNCSDVTVVAQPAAPVLTCTPDPVVPAGTVTCEVTGGNPDIDILWRASFNGVIASTGVRLDAQGRGTFTFIAPRSAAGQSVSVELVEWTEPISVGVTDQVSPGSLPAGEGSGGLPLLPILLSVGALVAIVRRLKVAEVPQAG